MSIGGVSGASGYSAPVFYPTGTAGATPAAATSSEDYLTSLAGGTGASASAGSQSSAQSMLEAIQDPTRYESAGYYNQMAMLNAFGGSSDSADQDAKDDPFAMLSQNVASTYGDRMARYTQYGGGVSSAGIDFTS